MLRLTIVFITIEFFVMYKISDKTLRRLVKNLDRFYDVNYKYKAVNPMYVKQTKSIYQIQAKKLSEQLKEEYSL